MNMIKFDEPDYTLLRGVSQEAIDLLKLLLFKSPENRISAEQSLNHIWLADCPVSMTRDDEERKSPSIEVENI